MSRREPFGSGAPGTEDEEDLVARSREWINRNKRDRDWLQSVDEFLESKGKCNRKRSRSRSRSRSPLSKSRSRSRSKDRRSRERRDSDRDSRASDDSDDYRRLMGERERNLRNREQRDRHRREDWDDYRYYDDVEEGEWVNADSWDDNDSNPNSEQEFNRYGGHLMELTSGEDRYAFRSQMPQKTIVIRGLAQHITEAYIRADILNLGLHFKDIRLVRRKDTGASRGFAFVEFYDQESASKWIESRQGQLTINQFRALMQYSFPTGKFVKKNNIAQKDWFCKCQAYNFNRRTTCYRCNLSRREGEVEVEAGAEEVSSYPTNTVLLRGLDGLTTEESVLKSIKVLSSLPIRSVRIGRDPVTHTSLCVCYLEMNNVQDSVSLHNALRDTELLIDERRASVSYAKLPPLGEKQTGKTTGRMADAALAAAQWSHQQTVDDNASTSTRQYTLKDIPRLAEYSASLYATNAQEKAAYLTYYEDYYKKQIKDGTAVQLPTSASAPAPTVYSAAPAVSSGSLSEPPDGSGKESYPTPDVSTYQYDKSSGYYYDPHTTLYYDASSQYYFNSKLSKFLYWDASKSTYLPAPTGQTKNDPTSCSTASSSVCMTEEQSEQKEQKEEEKKKEVEKDKIKVAKRIAKDMAKWAKTLNHKKEIAKQNIVAAQQAAAAQAKVPGSADIGYAVLERKELSTSALYNSSVDNRRESLVAAYSQGSDSEEEQQQPQQIYDDQKSPSADESQHVDLAKKVCTLCKRQFPSLDVLQKHVQMSDLHKQNLASWYQSRGSDQSDEMIQKKMQYRDRAKERRLKFGEPEKPKPNHLKEQYIKAMETTSYEEPTKQGITADNLGSKLLQKMGWKEGTGLGKANQGRTDIIHAQSRVKSAGLGTKSGSIYTPGPGETYRDCVKKMARMRYNELQD